MLKSFFATTLRGGTQYEHLDLVDVKRNIRKPADYWDRYQALGVYAVLDPEGNEMHYTCATSGTAEFYRKNKRFANGTVLVEESARHDSRTADHRRVGPEKREH